MIRIPGYTPTYTTPTLPQYARIAPSTPISPSLTVPIGLPPNQPPRATSTVLAYTGRPYDHLAHTYSATYAPTPSVGTTVGASPRAIVGATYTPTPSPTPGASPKAPKVSPKAGGVGLANGARWGYPPPLAPTPMRPLAARGAFSLPAGRSETLHAPWPPLNLAPPARAPKITTPLKGGGAVGEALGSVPCRPWRDALCPGRPLAAGMSSPRGLETLGFPSIAVDERVLNRRSHTRRHGIIYPTFSQIRPESRRLGVAGGASTLPGGLHVLRGPAGRAGAGGYPPRKHTGHFPRHKTPHTYPYRRPGIAPGPPPEI